MDANLLQDERLLMEDRKRAGILLINPNEDLKIDLIIWETKLEDSNLPLLLFCFRYLFPRNKHTDLCYIFLCTENIRPLEGDF